MKKDIINWLKQYFSKVSVLPKNFEECNYFEVNLIDSFGVIELIESLEEEFCIKFNEFHFQDRRFATVDGLSDIIIEIKKGQK